MELFLEKAGIMGMTGQIKNLNAAVWIFQRKNKSGWRDTIEDLTPDSERPIEGLKFLEPNEGT
jgi:hypothetical protein